MSKVTAGMASRQGASGAPGRETGLTLIEMLVTMVIGAFLMIGVISIFAQSRTTFRTNDAVERMQEAVRFALNTMQPDIRLAGNWGLHSDPTFVTAPNGATATCEDGTDVTNWALDPQLGVEASNGVNTLPCPVFANAFQPGSDVLVVRHASGQPQAAANTVIQLQSNRMGSTVFDTGAVPFACPAATPACTFDWQTQAYYVSSQSSLGPNVPSLRRQVLVPGGVLQDQELIPGVEDFQVLLGLDADGDDDVERFVHANDGALAILDPANPAFVDGAQIVAVRLWLMFRAEHPEQGFVDGNVYNYADMANVTPNDNFRRVLVNRTVLLRNARG
ncbi:MAG: PilW family protein [Gammaproteobacteria bacterium]|nr:MAG: PilW family protein [Gammaproteobacteria bacterium]